MQCVVIMSIITRNFEAKFFSELLLTLIHFLYIFRSWTLSLTILFLFLSSYAGDFTSKILVAIQQREILRNAAKMHVLKSDE